MDTFLVVRARRIQRYINASPRLRLIRGASQNIAIAEQEAADVIRNHSQARLAFVGGAHLTAVADSPDVASQLAGAIRLVFARRTPGLEIDIAVVDHADDFHTAVRDALAFSEPESVGWPDLPFVRPCDLCGRRPAATRFSLADGTHRVCDDCNVRLEVDPYSADGPESTLSRLRRQLETDHWRTSIVPVDDQARVGTIDDLATGRPPNYVAYLAVDGNNVGELLQGTQDLDQYAALSKTIAQIVEASVVEASLEVQRARGGHRLLPVVAGGDDFSAYVSTGTVFPFIVELLAQIDSAAQSRGVDFSVGIGLVIAHQNTAFGMLDEAALSLRGRAKKMTRAESAVAWDFVTTQQEKTVASQQEQAANPASEAARPPAYSGADLATLVEQARVLAAAKPPWSRLKRAVSLLRAERFSPMEYAEVHAAPSMRKQEIRAVLSAVESLPSGSSEHEEFAPLRTGEGWIGSAVGDLITISEMMR